MQRMILHIYRAVGDYNKVYDIEDIDVSKYDFISSMITNYSSISELILALENQEIDFEFQESDLIELVPGNEELNRMPFIDNLDFKNERNFLVIYGLGVKQIAIDHEIFNNELKVKYYEKIM